MRAYFRATLVYYYPFPSKELGLFLTFFNALIRPLFIAAPNSNNSITNNNNVASIFSRGNDSSNSNNVNVINDKAEKDKLLLKLSRIRLRYV